MSLLIVISIFLSPSFAWPTDQSYCPQNIKGKLPQNSKTKRKNLPTVVANLSQAKAYFSEVKKAKHNIPFDYVVDGCDMRAFFMSKAIFDETKAKSFRVSIESTSGFLTADTPKTVDGWVENKHHTATAICVEIGSTTSAYVIDPSFFTEPVPLSRWINNFTQPKEGHVPYKLTLSNMYALNPKKRPMNFKRNLKQAERERKASIKALSSGEPQIGPLRSRNRVRVTY